MALGAGEGGLVGVVGGKFERSVADPQKELPAIIKSGIVKRTIKQVMIAKRLGSMPPSDMEAVENNLRETLELKQRS